MENDSGGGIRGEKRDRGSGGNRGGNRRERKPIRARRDRDARPFKAVPDHSVKDTPTILAIQRRDEGSSSSASNRSDMNSSLLYQKHTTSRSHDRTPDAQSPSTPVQSTPAPVNPVEQHLKTGLAALLINNKFTESVSLIDASFQWSDKAFDMLYEQNDFVVVGCVGLQGAGKSTLLSMLTQKTSADGRMVFRAQKKSDLEKCIHRTVGVDIYVTEERLILLDTQPLLSPSMLDQYLRYDRKVAAEYATAEICLEVQALQMLSFLYTVCHVILVAQDYVIDVNLLNLLKTAEMLKPSTISHSSNSDGHGQEDINEFIPHLVFVQTCCDEQTFDTDIVLGLCESLSNFFQNSGLRTTGSASILRSPLLPYGQSKLFYSYQHFNLFLLPEINTSKDEKAHPISKYNGHPSLATLVKLLRQQLLAMPREQFTHHVLTERSWFHYAARTWEAVKKSNLIAEYHRLLSA